MSTINLTEWDTARGLQLSAAHVTTLAGSKFVRVAPDPGCAGTWQVSAQNYVGAISMDGLEIRIQPKVGVHRLVSLISRHLGLVDFPVDRVSWGADDDLTSVIAAALASEIEGLLAQGALSGYRTVDDSLLTIRGRINMGRHIAARAGLPLPIEVSYDDFTTDILENQLLIGAVLRLVRVQSLDAAVRRRLQHIRRSLTVTPAFAPEAANSIIWSRLNERYRVPVALAVVVLKATTIEDTVDRPVQASGFVVDMSKIFEAEVAAGLRQAASGDQLSVSAQYSASLDDDRYLSIRPDIVLLEHRQPVAIADTKYKLPDIRGVAVDDVYQVLAYAHRFNLSNVHLIYPAPPPRSRFQVGTVAVHLHHVDLELADSLRQQTYTELFDSLASSARIGTST